MRIFNLCLTGLLTAYAVYSQKRYGDRKAGVMGTGFFAIAFYLDSIFWLIMKNAAVGSHPVPTGSGGMGAEPGIVFQLMGILISKSILAIGLTAWTIIGRDFAGETGDGLEAECDRGGQSEQVVRPGRIGWTTQPGQKVRPGRIGWTAQPEQAVRIGQPGRLGRAQRGWQYLDGLTVGIGVFFVMLAVECMRDGRDGFSAALRLFFLLALLAGYYVSLFLYRKKLYDRERMAEIQMQRDEANLYLRNVEEQYQRTRELWHDLKNHISLLGLLLQEEKYGEMADYLRIFGDDVDSLTLPVKSGNLVVDALLADKVAKAKREGVQVELSLCDLTGLPLKPDEICSLLGNLLDNALEANRQVPEGKFLSVECREKMDLYYIKVQNAATGNGNADLNAMQIQGSDKLRAWGTDRLPSRKTDRRNQVGHGLGLRSMERIVHACGGELAVERTESRFTVVVRLPRIPVSYI